MVTNPIQWAFAMGVGILLLWRAQSLRRLRAAALAGLLLYVVLLTGLLLQGEAIFHAKDTVSGTLSASRALYWGVPMALLVALLLGSGPLTSGRPRRMLKAVGDASYSIYLSHLFIVRAAEEVVQRNWIPVGTGHGADLVVAGVLAASVAVGLGVYRWVERPLVHHARSRVNLFFFRHPEASLKRSAASGG